MFRLLRFILIAVWFMVFLGQSGCDFAEKAGHSVDKAISILEEGIDRFDRGQRDWQKILQDTRDKLISVGEKTLSDAVLGISTQISNAGIQTRCSADFLRNRARDDLVRLVGVVSGKEPVLKPSFCMPNPPTVNFAQVESGQQDKISIDGYNLDIPGTKVFLINNQGDQLDVSSTLAFPTPYLLTVNLGGNGVPLSPDSQKLIFKASDGTEIGSMNVIQPRKPIVTLTDRDSRSSFIFATRPQWVKAYGNKDCQEACKESDLEAIKAGVYHDTNSDMYVCSIEVGGAQRPGDNTEGQRTCHAATGGDAIHNDNKYCLCGTSTGNWVEGSGAADCGYVCESKGKQAILRGYSYVCSINAWDDGWRAGDNTKGDLKCSAASASKKCSHDRNKRCLCSD